MIDQDEIEMSIGSLARSRLVGAKLDFKFTKLKDKMMKINGIPYIFI